MRTRLEDVQQLLMRLSLLDAIHADACRYLYPDADPVCTLEKLIRRNVFISVATDAISNPSQETSGKSRQGRGEMEEYRLHPLFQSFLRRRIHTELGANGVAAEHKLCADYFLKSGLWEQAMSHLLAASDWDRAAQTLAMHGNEIIAAGALASLVSFAEAIPQEARDAHPRVQLHEGEVSRLRGDYKTAERMFLRAVPILAALGETEGEADALHSLAAIARRRGDCARAFEFLDRATSLAAERFE